MNFIYHSFKGLFIPPSFSDHGSDIELFYSCDNVHLLRSGRTRAFNAEISLVEEIPDQAATGKRGIFYGYSVVFPNQIN